MAQITVVGGSLAGMASAARLAKAGHSVTLCEASDHLGGRLATPGVWAPDLLFPAPVKDLFRKSGRPFDAEIARAGLRLVEAPAVTHRFADGTELPWPTDRAAQWHLLRARYSPALADSWRALLDELDEAWQLLRLAGCEAEPSADVLRRVRALRPRGARTLAQLTERAGHEHLGVLIADAAWLAGSDPRRTPAHQAARLSIERTFGRWMLTDPDDHLVFPDRLIDLLASRLATRKVDVRLNTPVLGIRGARAVTPTAAVDADALVCALPPAAHLALLDRTAAADRARKRAAALPAALTPRVTLARNDAPGPAASALAIRVDHTAAGPVVSYDAQTASGCVSVVHDHTHATATPAAGVAWTGARSLARRAPISTPEPRQVAVSAASYAGGEPWAQLLTAALGVYRLHEELTGADIRPTNRAYRP